MEIKSISAFKDAEYLGSLVSEAIEEFETRIETIDKTLVISQNEEERRALIFERESIELNNYAKVASFVVERLMGSLQSISTVCV